MDGTFEIRWFGVDGVARKHRFESTHCGHLRIEYASTGDRWREVGREPIEEVVIKTADGGPDIDP